MNPYRIRLSVVIAAGCLMTTQLAAHDAAHFAAGVPGDPTKPFRTVEVTMREDDQDHMSYAPAALEVKRGEQVKFIIKNAGAFVHEFVLADEKGNLKHAALMRKYPDMEHDDPNAKTVQPQAATEILWRFTRKSTFEYACLIPGHRQAGMLGRVSVK
jgi:uncharacterized cupredoxin-like copper-binding protein